jgi:hypothetical protein
MALRGLGLSSMPFNENNFKEWKQTIKDQSKCRVVPKYTLLTFIYHVIIYER